MNEGFIALKCSISVMFDSNWLRYFVIKASKESKEKRHKELTWFGLYDLRLCTRFR